ncbi:hypothetical protein DFS34DRAFT_637463 [Phlyctochytrium arcticum]|nr:hypothetical protein DFS34DRAFT_637463 [Phlyctochytrium arcticum]
MATPTSTNSRPIHGLDAWFVSGPMYRRDRRLREARVNAERTQRELRRDRGDLERKERHLMAQLRSFAQKGDVQKAKCLAHQIAHYRVTGDRNFEAGVMIDTRAQLLVSNHVINRAEVEAIKGIRYANVEEDLKTIRQRQEKYDTRLDMYETMEDIMNEGMDDVYEWGETHKKREKEFELEAESVIRNGVEPKWGREYFERESAYIKGGPIPRGANSLHVLIRIFSPRNQSSLFSQTASTSTSPISGANPFAVPAANPINANTDPVTLRKVAIPSIEGVVVHIPTLDISIDMLQRLVCKDAHVIHALGLESGLPKARKGTWRGSVYDSVFGTARRFRIGTPVGGDPFDNYAGGSLEPYSVTASLKSLGFKNGEIVWVQPLEPVRDFAAR